VSKGCTRPYSTLAVHSFQGGERHKAYTPFVSVCLLRLASRPRPSIVWRVKEHMARNGGEEAGRPNLPSARG
jgi:hypothetical protein